MNCLSASAPSATPTARVWRRRVWRRRRRRLAGRTPRAPPTRSEWGSRRGADFARAPPRRRAARRGRRRRRSCASHLASRRPSRRRDPRGREVSPPPREAPRAPRPRRRRRRDRPRSARSPRTRARTCATRGSSSSASSAPRDLRRRAFGFRQPRPTTCAGRPLTPTCRDMLCARAKRRLLARGRPRAVHERREHPVASGKTRPAGASGLARGERACHHRDAPRGANAPRSARGRYPGTAPRVWSPGGTYPWWGRDRRRGRGGGGFARGAIPCRRREARVVDGGHLLQPGARGGGGEKGTVAATAALARRRRRGTPRPIVAGGPGENGARIGGGEDRGRFASSSRFSSGSSSAAVALTPALEPAAVSLGGAQPTIFSSCANVSASCRSVKREALPHTNSLSLAGSSFFVIAPRAAASPPPPRKPERHLDLRSSSSLLLSSSSSSSSSLSSLLVLLLSLLSLSRRSFIEQYKRQQSNTLRRAQTAVVFFTRDASPRAFVLLVVLAAASVVRTGSRIFARRTVPVCPNLPPSRPPARRTRPPRRFEAKFPSRSIRQPPGAPVARDRRGVSAPCSSESSSEADGPRRSRLRHLRRLFLRLSRHPAYPPPWRVRPSPLRRHQLHGICAAYARVCLVPPPWPPPPRRPLHLVSVRSLACPRASNGEFARRRLSEWSRAAARRVRRTLSREPANISRLGLKRTSFAFIRARAPEGVGRLTQQRC